MWKVDIFNVYNARGMQTDPYQADSFNIDQPPLTPEQQITGSHSYTGDNIYPGDDKTSGPTAIRPIANTPMVPGLDGAAFTALQQQQQQYNQSGAGSPGNRSGLPLVPLGSKH
jgi:hypothetical protein